MARNTLVAVGGSGQSAAIAYLRMATLSGMPAEQLPNIYVIDADVKDRNGASAKPSLYSSLKILFTQLTQGVAANNRPRLDLIYPYANQADLMSNSTVFADYIISKGGHKQDMALVTDALFSKKLNNRNYDQILSEQDVPLSKGFMARPNVGATTFFDKLHPAQERLETALTQLKDAVSSGQNQAVTVVIGSSFGGTGSGVAPSLAQELAKWATKAGQTPRIGLFMTLPWFNPNGERTQPDAVPTHGSAEVQKKNTAGGLRYYATSETFNDFDVFVADYAGHIQIRNDDSNSEQPEYEHVFNILLAAQIQNYFLKKIHDEDFSKQTGAYTFYAPKKDAGQTIEFQAKDSALLSYAVQKDLKQDLQNWAYEAQSLRLVLRHISNFIQKDFKLSDASSRKVPSVFADLALEVAKKDGRPNMVEKSGWGPFAKEKAAHEIYRHIAEKLSEREKQLGASIAWLKALSNNCLELKIHEAATHDRPDAFYKEYDALKNDRNFEVASVRVFEEALDKNQQNLVNNLTNKIDNGQHMFDAVAVVVEEALRHAIRHVTKNHRAQDERVNASENSGTLNTIFIPMQAGNSSHLVNAYWQKIDLKDLVEKGKNRQAEDIDIFDPQHPATLTDLNHFSIPSPWGAALLEQWQQKAAVEAAKQNNPLKLQRAAERLEAILWAIFNKKLLVKTIRADERGSIAYTALEVLKTEIKPKGMEIDRISVAINPINQQLVAANYPTVGWFATPSMMGSLRTWWDDDKEKDLLMTLPTELAPKLLADSYDARLIKSFVSWIKNILDVHGDSGRSAAWYEVLKYTYEKLIPFISEETQVLDLPQTTEFFLLQLPNKEILQVPVLQVRESINEIIENACCNDLIALEKETSAGVFEIQVPSSPLKTTTRGTAIKLHESGPMSERGDSRYIHVTYMLDLPEGKFQVKRKARIEFLKIQQVIWPNFKADGWKLYFAGGTATDNISLINQTSPNYAYRLYTQLENGTYEEVRYLLATSDEPQTFKEPLHFDCNYELFGRPDVLVLLEKDKQSGIYNEVGMLNVNLKQPESSDTLQFKLGLDFGTSHSCVMALDSSDRKINLIDFTRPTELNNLITHVIQTPRGDDLLLDEFRFLSPFAALAQSNDWDKNVLPTEFRAKKGNTHTQPHKEIDAGIRYLTILPMQFNNKLAEYSIKDTGALGDFKWGTTKASSLINTSYEGAESELSKQYIKQILRMALAMLRNKGYTKLVTFRATYPEAFNTARINVFANDLDLIWEKLLLETGLHIDQPITSSALLKLKDFSQGTDLTNGQGLSELSHGLVSESIGALQTTLKTSARNLLSDKKLQIVLDMGGGSTDVAAFLNRSVFSNTLPKEIPTSLTDSIRYAGHDILNLLIDPAIAQVLDDNYQGSQDPQQLMRVIKMAMRNTHKVSALQTKFIEGNFAISVREKVRAFFEGLFEYTRQLITSYQTQLLAVGEEDLTVGIVLLGNGWRLGNLVYTAENIETDIKGLIHEMEQYLNKNLEGVSNLKTVFPAGLDISVKESIAYGALLYNANEQDVMQTGESSLARQRYSFVGDTKLTDHDYSFVGQQKANERRNQQPIQIENLPNFPANTNFVSRLDRLESEENKGLYFAKNELNTQLRLHWRSQEDEILISPMQLFLEHVWKPALLKDEQQ